MGNTRPNTYSILDLTNTIIKNDAFNLSERLGFVLPGVTTANLPSNPNTGAENGLVVFNTTIGCPQYAYNGTWYPSVHGSITYSSEGLYTWVVPTCVSNITVVASGGGALYAPTGYTKSYGAVVTATVTVVPTHSIEIVVGNYNCTENSAEGGGGGGGTFVWDNASTTYPLVVAGGAGGSGTGGEGANGSTTIFENSSGNDGGGNIGGLAGNAGGSTSGSGAGGGGWNTTSAQANPAATGTYTGEGGTGEPNSFSAGAGATSDAGWGGCGGYGGGGGGGATSGNVGGSGGGGGGYNGGGGGNVTGYYGGGGGGSGYYNGTSFVNPVTVTQTNCCTGSVTITW